MVGAVEQEGAQQIGVARHETRAQAGGVGAFGEAGEHDDAFAASSKLRGGLQGACRFLVGIDFGIAFVGGDHEAVFVLQGKQFLPVGKAHHAAAGVVGRAGEEDFDVRPDVGGNGIPVGQKARRGAVGKIDFAAAEEGGAFVNLVKRVGADDNLPIVCGGVEHGLDEGKEGFAAAEHGQDFAFGVETQAVVAAFQPAGAGLAQLGQACGERVLGKFCGRGGECVGNQGGRGVLGFADLQHDGFEVRGRGDALHGFAQAGEGVGLEFV
ncbi:hypothetical protein HMPREF9120_02695 [Neisseria sp. oral taxon 020 str. F0370]|nr:hypothetical protein HMPREF9120_02695 [Neisseria sp. oral taxon 020 str. F0370]